MLDIAEVAFVSFCDVVVYDTEPDADCILVDELRLSQLERFETLLTT